MATKHEKRGLPKLGRHSSGQARVTIAGKVHYLGAWGSLEAQTRYADLLTQWEAGGRQPLEPTATCVQVRKVHDLLDAYLAYLDGAGRYHKDGKPTSQRKVCKLALDEFSVTCGDVLATKLRDVLLLQHRDVLEQRVTLSRGGINRKMQHLRAALRWAWQRGMLSRDQWLGVSAVESLRRHECGGRDWKRPKRAVTSEDVEKVAKEAPVQVARMLHVQAAVGMRPGEVCAMRWCDLSTEPVDVDGVPCTIYTVLHAKNEHHGKGPTTYCLPPSVFAMLGKPTGPGTYVFPSPVTGRGYIAHAYRNAVAKACVRAGVQHFGPHELRHAFLTQAARRYGVLAASSAANHSDTRVTSGYLHANKLDGYRCVVGLSRDSDAKTG